MTAWLPGETGAGIEPASALHSDRMSGIPPGRARGTAMVKNHPHRISGLFKAYKAKNTGCCLESPAGPAFFCLLWFQSTTVFQIVHMKKAANIPPIAFLGFRWYNRGQKREGGTAVSEFSELIKNFDKIREYMRDFYVYGFKTRGDYTAKSARTYDNERRRIESWMAGSVRWENSAKGKRVFLSVDSARVPQNPLYAAWKSKSFTKTDIRLHFFLLDLFADGEAWTIEQATDAMSERYGAVFDAQTVRAKLREYEREGVVRSEKRGRALYYTLSARALDSMPCRRELLDAVQFFQEVAPFGFVGSTLLDTAGEENDLFYFKHHFIVHALEDGVLGALTGAIDGRRSVTLENYSRRSGHRTLIQGVPLRILVSVPPVCQSPPGQHRDRIARGICTRI